MLLSIGHTGCIHIDCHDNMNTPEQRAIALSQNVAVVDRMVEDAVKSDVKAFLVVGDNTEFGNPSSNTYCALAKSLRPLVKAGIPIVMVGGNHERLRHTAGERTATVVAAAMLNGEVWIAEDEPTLVTTSSGVQVACLPWVDVNTVLAEKDKMSLASEDANRLVEKEILAKLESVLKQAHPSLPLVVAAHITVAGASRASENDSPVFREPVVSGAELTALCDRYNVAYIALNHLHRAQQVGHNAFYAGSPQRHTFTDEDDPKGWNLVVIDLDKLVSVTQVPTPARTFQTIDLNSTTTAVVKSGALVRVKTLPGQEVPATVSQAIVSAGSIQTPPILTPADPDPGQVITRQVIDYSLSDRDALVEWSGANRPDIDEDFILALAQEIAQ